MEAGQAKSSVGAPAVQKPGSVVVAAAVPGMLNDNPVKYLPGMSPVRPDITAINALPHPLITDLTNYPNPFDSRKSGGAGTTVISYQLVKDAKTTVTLYDLLGTKVREWVFTAGTNGARLGGNTVSWDGTNEAGQKVSKGGYFAQIYVEAPETNVMVIRKIGVIH